MKNKDNLSSFVDVKRKSRDFNVKVIGKWMRGVIWKRPYLSIEFMDDIVPKYYDLPVRMAFWNAVEKGINITIEMELCKDNGLWYPVYNITSK